MPRNPLTPTVRAIIEMVLTNEENVMSFTDAQLIVEINKLLTSRQIIDEAAFRRYRDRYMQAADKPKERLYQQLAQMIDEARNDLKKTILRKLGEKDTGWQRWKWLLENKYVEFNPKSRDVFQQLEIPRLEPRNRNDD